MKPSGRPILAAVKRAYAAQAQASRPADKVSLPKQEPRITKLPNGAIVASLENYSPIARVAVAYNAGPRHESSQQAGITHCIRNAANLSTEKATGFAITRSIQQIGGSLGCTSTRENVLYTVECMRDDLDTGVEMLGHVATSPAFKVWEVAGANERLRLDLAMYQQNPSAQLMEGLHKAAYRDTLGNSLYMPEFKVGSFSPDALKNFVAQHYTSSNLALVGTGVEHDKLLAYAKKLIHNTGAAPAAQAAKYYGGEARIENSSPLVHAAVAMEGASLANSDLLAFYVLQKAMGSGQFVKYGSNVATSKVSQAAAQATNSPFASACFNCSYADSGLFGFHVVAQAGDMDKVLKSVMAAFADAAKGSITDADVQRAKNQLKATGLMEMENSQNILEDIAIQSLLSGQVLSMQDISEAVDKLTVADIQAVAKKVLSGKKSMAAVGDLSSTPYLDQLA